MELSKINLLRNFKHSTYYRTIERRAGTRRGTSTTTLGPLPLDPTITIPTSIRFKGEILGYFQEADIIREYKKQVKLVGVYHTRHARAVIKECKTIDEVLDFLGK
jgi:hypothetical protein